LVRTGKLSVNGVVYDADQLLIAVRQSVADDLAQLRAGTDISLVEQNRRLSSLRFFYQQRVACEPGLLGPRIPSSKRTD
jgi:hypothetical protein